MAEAILIKTDDVLKFTSLNGGLDPDKFIQYIKIAQDTNIQEALGSNLFEKLKSDVLSGTISGDYLQLITDHVKPMLIHWSMVYFLPFASYTIGNKGVYKHGSENSTNIDRREVEFLVQRHRDIAESYTEKFLKYMSVNSDKFPEYSNNTKEDVKPQGVSYTSGWYIR